MVQRHNDKRIGRVVLVVYRMEDVQCFRFPAPPRYGDVVVEYSAGSHTIISGPPYFWTKYRRVDIAEMTSLALDAACQHEP